MPSIDGVEILHTPVFKTEDYSPEMMAKYVRDALYEDSSYISSFTSRRFQLYASGKTEVITLSLSTSRQLNLITGLYGAVLTNLGSRWLVIRQYSAACKRQSNGRLSGTLYSGER
jgi:hypothetical protein